VTVGTFILAATVLAAPPWRFAVIGDTQANPRIFTRAAASLRSSAAKLDFVIHVGEMAACGNKRLWHPQKRLMASTGLRWHLVIGNHELWSCDRNYRHLGWFSRRHWVRYWYGGTGSTMRWFRHRGKLFILLDTAGKYLPRGHLAKLQKLLSGVKRGSVFLFSHKSFPTPPRITPRVWYGPRNTRGYRRWHWQSSMTDMPYRYSNRKFWLTLYHNRAKIVASFHGHWHAYRRYVYPGGMPGICTGGGGGWLQTHIDYYHYLIVTVKQRGFAVKLVKLGR
jgi:hypothetical protein